MLVAVCSYEVAGSARVFSGIVVERACCSRGTTMAGLVEFVVDAGSSANEAGGKRRVRKNMMGSLRASSYSNRSYQTCLAATLKEQPTASIHTNLTNIKVVSTMPMNGEDRKAWLYRWGRLRTLPVLCSMTVRVHATTGQNALCHDTRLEGVSESG